MHWPTDVAASIVFTVTWLLLLRTILLPPDVDDRRPGHGAAPPAPRNG
jgi:undecaprenyl-diphosphatase